MSNCLNGLTRPHPDRFYEALQSCVASDNLLTEQSDCWAYGYDNSRRQGMPGAVVFPTNHEEVLAVVKICNQFSVPIIPRGRGTGTTGATVPLGSELILSTERMKRVIDFSPENRLIVVEPGVSNGAVQSIVGERGFFWPPDPTSSTFCSIGGNLAYNSAGPRAVKYGTPRENCLALRIVTGDGRDLRTGTRTSKGVVGYDLTRLVIGSEGTLAIITEATLKLAPKADAKTTLQAFYANIESAAQAVSAIMAQPETPCALEFIDRNALDLVRKEAGLTIPDNAGALLMIEADGNSASLQTSVKSIQDAAKTDGLLSLQVAKTQEETGQLWQVRKSLSPALRKIAPKKINEDVAVPVSKLPELITGLDALSQQFRLPIVNFGHAGNGNIHVNLLIDPDDPEQSKRAESCLEEVFTLVLKLGGTLSGEHGVGLEKRDFIARELGHEAINLMQAIKQQFDPNGILNPGKSLPKTPISEQL